MIFGLAIILLLILVAALMGAAMRHEKEQNTLVARIERRKADIIEIMYED
jgi:hypothetical protein